MTHKSEREKAHYGLYLIWVVCFVSLGSVSFGYSAAIIGTTLGQPSFYKDMRLDTNPDVNALLGAMNALFFTGGIFGSICHGWVAQKYGRKASIISGCILLIISGALLTGSVNPGMFIAFRFVNGWG